MQKREIAIYVFVGLSSLFVISYVVHMFVGGLVDEDTENKITVGVLIFWTLLLTAMGIDIAKRRRRR